MIGYLVLYAFGFSLLLVSSSLNNCVSNELITRKNAYMSKFCFFLAFSIFFIWTIIRGIISIDLRITYLDGYRDVTTYGFSERFDFLFNYFFTIANDIFSDFQGFIILTGSVFICTHYYAFKKLSINPAYSALLWLNFNLLYTGLNQIRQYTGFCFFCIGLVFFEKRKFFITFIFVLAAALTHSGCYVLFIIFIIPKLKISKKGYITILILSPCLWLIAPYILRFVFLNFLNGRYAKYVFGGGTEAFLGKFIIPMIKTWGLSFIYLLNYDAAKKEDKNNIYINLMLLATIIAPLGMINTETPRIVNMLFYCQVFYIPSLVKHIRENSTHHTLWIFYLLFNFMYLCFKTYEKMREYPYYISDYIKKLF